MKKQLKPWTNPYHFIATGFGFGLAPKAPGTVGTIAGVLIYLLIQDLSLISYATLLTIFTATGIWICDIVSKDLGVEDHQSIVWDEVCGYLLTMLLAPKGWFWISLGFVLFRLFDILKPWPIRAIEKKLKGGLGVMVDDLVAAIPAWLILQFIAYWYL